MTNEQRTLQDLLAEQERVRTRHGELSAEVEAAEASLDQTRAALIRGDVDAASPVVTAQATYTALREALDDVGFMLNDLNDQIDRTREREAIAAKVELIRPLAESARASWATYNDAWAAGTAAIGQAIDTMIASYDLRQSLQQEASAIRESATDAKALDAALQAAGIDVSIVREVGQQRPEGLYADVVMAIYAETVNRRFQEAIRARDQAWRDRRAREATQRAERIGRPAPTGVRVNDDA